MLKDKNIVIGITGGIAGTGIGLGIGSAAYALKTILGK